MADTGDMTAAVEAAFASSTPEPATPSTTESTSASTTETPVAEGTPTAEPIGPVPYERFKGVNEQLGLSKKELETLAWAKAIKSEHAPHVAAFYQRISHDPMSILEYEVKDLLSNPQTAAQVRSWAARTLGTRVAGAAGTEPVDNGEPQPDLQFQDGTTTYSADQLRKRDAWRDAQRDSQWEQKVDQRLKPLQDYNQKQVSADIRAQAKVDATTEVTALKQQPYFEEHRSDVRAAMIADESLTLKQAWAQVFIEKVIPKIQSGKAAVSVQKTQAGTANPARPSGAAPGPPKDFHEALTRAFGK